MIPPPPFWNLKIQKAHKGNLFIKKSLLFRGCWNWPLVKQLYLVMILNLKKIVQFCDVTKSDKSSTRTFNQISMLNKTWKLKHHFVILTTYRNLIWRFGNYWEKKTQKSNNRKNTPEINIHIYVNFYCLFFQLKKRRKKPHYYQELFFILWYMAKFSKKIAKIILENSFFPNNFNALSRNGGKKKKKKH